MSIMYATKVTKKKNLVQQIEKSARIATCLLQFKSVQLNFNGETIELLQR